MNFQRHDIPISAIPCLAYRRALEEETKQKEIDRKIEEQIKNGTWATNGKGKPEGKQDELNEEIDLSKNIDNSETKGDKEPVEVTCPYGNFVNSVSENEVKKLDHVDKKDIKDVELNNLDNGVDKDTEVCDKVVEDVLENGTSEDVCEGVVAVNGSAGSDVPRHRQPVVLPGGLVMPPPRVETVSTSWKTQHLTHDQVNGYCKKLFKFKTVNIMHFK